MPGSMSNCSSKITKCYDTHCSVLTIEVQSTGNSNKRRRQRNSPITRVYSPAASTACDVDCIHESIAQNSVTDRYKGFNQFASGVPQPRDQQL